MSLPAGTDDNVTNGENGGPISLAPTDCGVNPVLTISCLKPAAYADAGTCSVTSPLSNERIAAVLLRSKISCASSDCTEDDVVVSKRLVVVVGRVVSGGTTGDDVVAIVALVVEVETAVVVVVAVVVEVIVVVVVVLVARYETQNASSLHCVAQKPSTRQFFCTPRQSLTQHRHHGGVPRAAPDCKQVQLGGRVRSVTVGIVVVGGRGVVVAVVGGRVVVVVVVVVVDGTIVVVGRVVVVVVGLGVGLGVGFGVIGGVGNIARVAVSDRPA
jgi:hypothetical protein